MENAVLREFVRYDHMWETWVENEDVTVDYPQSVVEFIVHSDKDLDRESWSGFPEWITPIGDAASPDGFVFSCQVSANRGRNYRSATLKIDTAVVRITQRSAGDYSTDYGEDYS